MRLRLALISASVFLLALLAVSSAIAAPAWLAPTDLSEEGQKAVGPRIAFDAQGDAMAVWERREGTDDSVRAAFRTIGGTWQAPVSLGSCGESGCEPSVAFDGKGNAVVVWELYNGAHSNVEATVKPVGGSWQTPVYLSSDEHPGADHPHLAGADQLSQFDSPTPLL